MVDRLVRAKRGLEGLCDSSGATFSCRLYVMNTIQALTEKSTKYPLWSRSGGEQQHLGGARNSP